ncbi:choline dehydrogenase-like flavoprotein [Anseongella ginsenosidimutans]|uniref:Choline dehydrogenase-like flavoprotein n=1 Tax=Anseongella ginsenosidimutans TaxID=496056 RepID=A0A4R3KW91_9SPHI|nr:GMC family oxidoreductase [Anseongella ginsenosidimutans]QEC51863.1 GMC family oxidoreductase [Anseongella ginsenosidimutans]TCS89244.1 choline dehydrogenase-like flavoprotein [Anseongella ginsenosidimutans]
MAYLNINSIKERTFDAIVIGSGMSGGWAAKELTDNGLKTLVLERGRDVKHIKDYPTANMYPFEFEHRGELPLAVKKENPVVGRCYAFGESTAHFFVKDKEHPYIQEKEFDWIRAYQVGGRSLLWARQTQRWSDFDFSGPARDGFAVDWPIRYADIAPWYSHVEKFAGIAGNKDGLQELPDGEFLPGFPLNAVEDYFKKQVSEKFKGRHIISGRCAHLSRPEPVHLEQGRGQCLSRTLCNRGCPLGGYYSSNSSTLPWAAKSGHLTLRPFSVVHSILYDEQKGRASGVRVIDANTKEETEYYAKIIFVNAGSVNTNLVLLNSVSGRFPAGLGNDNGLLGKYVAFHNYSATISAEFDGLKEFTTDGRRPTGGYVPRFRNVFKQETDFLRGYAAGFSAHRGLDRDTGGFGTELKENILNPQLGPWRVGSHMMAETIPKESNYVSLDPDRKDAWGIPQLRISVAYDDNDEKMRKDYLAQFEEMFAAAGFTNIQPRNKPMAPGLDIHEMGGVRMGKDPKTSLLNKWNQFHACKNVFVTDGACMTSTSTQNPSLTYMAITARAANYAAEELKKRNL